MPLQHRKVPFSTKQKKEQLKAKRERKHNEQTGDEESTYRRDRKKDGVLVGHDVRKLNQQPTRKPSDEINRYRLHFKADTNADVQRGTRLSRQPIVPVTEEGLELSMDNAYPTDVILDMPKRPAWDYSSTPAQLEEIEQSYFRSYVSSVMKKVDATREMSYFELNLETWRQLWRVLEMSDVILLISDIRYPALHFSPALYDHVINDLKKSLILVLNKVDLAPVELVVAWKHYFVSKFPQLHIVCFTSHTSNLHQTTGDPGNVLRQKKKNLKSSSAVGPKQLLDVCEEITSGAVDMSSWREKIEFDSSASGGAAPDCEVGTVVTVDADDVTRPLPDQQLYDGGILTIGCCGYPNVGKSSLINGLMGRKVVSVSRTPGHTKHFQTIYLTNHVRLCDSPGLVFPSLIRRPLQILSGIYPIAQLREPFSVVQYLAERLPLADLLRLRHPELETGSSGHLPWTAFDICEAWAVKRGFLTAKAARPDSYRAANNILRLAGEGRLCLCTRPPEFSRRKEEWLNHPDTVRLSNLLGFVSRPDQEAGHSTDSSESESDSTDSSSEEGRRGADENSEEDDEMKCAVKSVDDDAPPSASRRVKHRSVKNRSVKVNNPFELLADDDD